MVEIAGEPRSLAEMDFVAGMRPCEACGDWRPVAWRIGGVDHTWIVRGSCQRCATERAYAFSCPRDLVEVVPRELELGGAEPSQVVEPYELLCEIDRLVPHIVEVPERLDGDIWLANEAVVDRVRTALGELAKFLGTGSTIETHRTPAGRRDRTSRPERYTRTWIATERAHWDAVAARIAADAPRILAADRMVSRPKSPRGQLTIDSIAAHRVWLDTNAAQGRRLDIVTADAGDVHLRGARLADCRLEGMRCIGADLVGTELDRAELVEVELAGARAETASFSGAHLTGCSFVDAVGESAVFSLARVRGCDFTRAQLAWSHWERATLEGCRFHGTVLDDAQLQLAHLVDCDLRGALLTGAVLAGAVLERCDLRGVDLANCDLRGATLVGCAVGGATGIPAATAGWLVRDADFSPARDGTDLGDGDDLLEELRG